jgi:hypothetical protein
MRADHGLVTTREWAVGLEKVRWPPDAIVTALVESPVARA